MRIARQLHDELAHTLSVISLHTDVAREALDDAERTTAGAALGRVREAVGGATRELRATVGLLRADVEPAPGLSRIDGLVSACAHGGLRIELVTDGDFSDVPAVVGSTAYRIVQEALTNVRRHARAGTATVTLCRVPGALTVRIGDDGDGAAPVAEGHGLAGMRERAALLGGVLTAGPGASGWEVSAVLPLGGAG